MAETMNSGNNSMTDFNAGRLFTGSCLSLIATSVTFAVIGGIMGSLKTSFVLDNEEVGQIGGAALWGFTISIFILGPLVDGLGMKLLLRFAFLCHTAGVLVMIFAGGFWALFWGALILALGNGTVEAACNPLVATVYPDRKTEKLNQFHVWFPGGIVIGGLACFALDELKIGDWRVKLCLILVPTLIYGLLFLGQKFPTTERVQSGVTFGGMFRATLLRPLFLLLFFCMMLTASLELGPNRWVTAILESGGMHGILVLVWISGLMAVLRFYAGPVVHRLSPTGLLLVSAILTGIGLFWLSMATSMAIAFMAATIFALGICYFWPTMLGVVSERVPKGGALALALMGGVGMLAVGLVTTPLMGKITDSYLHEELERDEASINKVVVCLTNVTTTFPELEKEAEGGQKKDIQNAIKDVSKVLAAATADPAKPKLPETDTANALRAAIGVGGDAPAAKEASDILNPADNYGGRMAFRWVAPLSIILIVIFGLLYSRDRAAGGYKVEKI